METPSGKPKDRTCRKFAVDTTTDRGDQEPEVTIETIGRQQQTKRFFAQGHDAKLVGFLVRAELAGKEIRYGRSEGVLVDTDAVRAARTAPEALAGKVANMLTLAREKAQRVAAEKTKSAPAPGPCGHDQSCRSDLRGHDQAGRGGQLQHQVRRDQDRCRWDHP